MPAGRPKVLTDSLTMGISITKVVLARLKNYAAMRNMSLSAAIRDLIEKFTPELPD